MSKLGVLEFKELVAVGPEDDLFLVRGSWEDGSELTEEELTAVGDLYMDLVYDAWIRGRRC